MRVVLVHDYLVQFGGAERVLLALAELFPDAPIYTLFADDHCTDYFPRREIKASFLNRLPRWLKKRRRWLLPLLPAVVERFDLSAFDLVISSSSAFAKNIRVGPSAVHLCYCHAPSRFLWDYHGAYLDDVRAGVLPRLFAALFLKSMRKRDRDAARRVRFWIANSRTTQTALLKQYGVSSTVIYPPRAELSLGKGIADRRIPQKFFLVVARLVAYKKIDLIIQAFNALELPLVIVGDGPERKRLETLARVNIVFAGFVPDDELGAYYERSRAFIMANEEDFGLAAVEAMNFGKPVLAFKKGGATEWLESGKTGEFFSTQTPLAIADGVRKLIVRLPAYDPSLIRAKASLFTKKRFQKAFLDYLAAQGVIHQSPEN